MTHHAFRFNRPPRLQDWLPAAACILFACSVTWVAVGTTFKPTEELADKFAMWLLALGNWFLIVFVTQPVWRHWRALKRGTAVITLDDDGIALAALSGKAIKLNWTDLETLALSHGDNKTSLLVKVGRLSCSVPLDDLDADPSHIWQMTKSYAERSKR